MATYTDSQLVCGNFTATNGGGTVNIATVPSGKTWILTSFRISVSASNSVANVTIKVGQTGTSPCTIFSWTAGGTNANIPALAIGANGGTGTNGGAGMVDLLEAANSGGTIHAHNSAILLQTDKIDLACTGTSSSCTIQVWISGIVVS